jgi:uncharacterized integral membrane protein
MSIRTVVIAVTLSLLVLFALINWSAFVAPTHLSLLVTSIDAPLGLIMLGITALIAAVLLSFVLKVHITALADSRTQSAEMRTQRELASQAEASRFTELQKYIEKEIRALREAQEASARQLREDLTVSTNSLAASVGEIDERLERQIPTPPALRP